MRNFSNIARVLGQAELAGATLEITLDGLLPPIGHDWARDGIGVIIGRQAAAIPADRSLPSRLREYDEAVAAIGEGNTAQAWQRLHRARDRVAIAVARAGHWSSDSRWSWHSHKNRVNYDPDPVQIAEIEQNDDPIAVARLSVQ